MCIWVHVVTATFNNTSVISWLYNTCENRTSCLRTKHFITCQIGLEKNSYPISTYHDIQLLHLTLNHTFHMLYHTCPLDNRKYDFRHHYNKCWILHDWIPNHVVMSSLVLIGTILDFYIQHRRQHHPSSENILYCIFL